jgi:thymidylate kinase
MSKIVVIEGPDRVGKQTQTRLLQEYITKTGLGAVVVEVPIRSAITYRIIYWMLQNGLAKKFPKVFQCFQFLNRKIFQILSLPGIERMYDVVIFDRWSLSTIVYGGAEGVPEKFTLQLANWLRKPDHTIILHGTSYLREAEDSYEADKDLQDKVRIGYFSWGSNNPTISTTIDCRQDKNIISRKIQTVLREKGILS